MSELIASDLFESLYRQYHEPLIGYLTRMTRCRSRA